MADFMSNANPLASTSGVNVNISNPSTIPTQASAINSLLFNPLLQAKHNVQSVNDEREIYTLPMGIDSSDFVLHATKPIIYFVATDGSGQKKSIIPFDITQHIQEPEPTMQDVKAIEDRMEEKFSAFKNEMSDLIAKKLEEVLK